MAKHQKNKDPERWLLHNRNGKAPSAATSAIFKAETEGRALSGGSSIVYNAGQSLGPGGRKLKTVDSGADGLFGDDEDEAAKKKKAKEYGGEGDLDEMLFEDDFADDEEKVEEDNDDEEAKELEVTYFLMLLAMFCIIDGDAGTAQTGVQERQ
jgi:transcription initiation factor TFIIF subunit alpha